MIRIKIYLVNNTSSVFTYQNIFLKRTHFTSFRGLPVQYFFLLVFQIKNSSSSANVTSSQRSKTVSISDMTSSPTVSTDLDLSVDENMFAYIEGANYLMDSPKNIIKRSKESEQACLTEEDISVYIKNFNLTREKVHEFYAEFLAYDLDGNGFITLKVA